MNRIALIAFIILATIAYLHAFGIIDPFKQLPSSAWIWLTTGIALGILAGRWIYEEG